MRPLDLQQIGGEIAIRWDDGSEQFISLETLRRACPCAGCKGEVDILGQLHKGREVGLSAHSFRLQGLKSVGTYAIQPIWGDGHSTGLFSFDYLKRIGESTKTGEG